MKACCFRKGDVVGAQGMGVRKKSMSLHTDKLRLVVPVEEREVV